MAAEMVDLLTVLGATASPPLRVADVSPPTVEGQVHAVFRRAIVQPHEGEVWRCLRWSMALQRRRWSASASTASASCPGSSLALRSGGSGRRGGRPSGRERVWGFRV